MKKINNLFNQNESWGRTESHPQMGMEKFLAEFPRLENHQFPFSLSTEGQEDYLVPGKYSEYILKHFLNLTIFWAVLFAPVSNSSQTHSQASGRCWWGHTGLPSDSVFSSPQSLRSPVCCVDLSGLVFPSTCLGDEVSSPDSVKKILGSEPCSTLGKCSAIWSGVCQGRCFIARPP